MIELWVNSVMFVLGWQVSLNSGSPQWLGRSPPVKGKVTLEIAPQEKVRSQSEKVAAPSQNDVVKDSTNAVVTRREGKE